MEKLKILILFMLLYASLLHLPNRFKTIYLSLINISISF